MINRTLNLKMQFRIQGPAVSIGHFADLEMSQMENLVVIGYCSEA